MVERRLASQRRHVLKAGGVFSNNGGATISATVKNISETGALLVVEGIIGVPDQIKANDLKRTQDRMETNKANGRSVFVEVPMCSRRAARRFFYAPLQPLLPIRKSRFHGGNTSSSSVGRADKAMIYATAKIP